MELFVLKGCVDRPLIGCLKLYRTWGTEAFAYLCRGPSPSPATTSNLFAFGLRIHQAITAGVSSSLLHQAFPLKLCFQSMPAHRNVRTLAIGIHQSGCKYPLLQKPNHGKKTVKNGKFRQAVFGYLPKGIFVFTIKQDPVKNRNAGFSYIANMERSYSVAVTFFIVELFSKKLIQVVFFKLNIGRISTCTGIGLLALK